MADLHLTLSADQAAVLLDWCVELDRRGGPKRHPGTQQGLWNFEATLERLVVEQFCADYEARLNQAKARPLGTPGALPRTDYVDDVTAVLTPEESIVMHHWLTEGFAEEALDVDPASAAALTRVQVLLAQELAGVLATDPEGAFVAARSSLDWSDL